MIKATVDKGEYQHEMKGDGMTLTAETVCIIMGVYAGIRAKSSLHATMFREALKAMVNDEEFWEKEWVEAADGKIDVSGMTDDEIAAMKREHGFS